MEADVKRRPAATLSERRAFLEKVASVGVSEPTVSWMLRRQGWIRNKMSVGASERDEFLRAAWRALVAREIHAERLVFVDEMGANISLAP